MCCLKGLDFDAEREECLSRKQHTQQFIVFHRTDIADNVYLETHWDGFCSSLKCSSLQELFQHSWWELYFSVIFMVNYEVCYFWSEAFLCKWKKSHLSFVIIIIFDIYIYFQATVPIPTCEKVLDFLCLPFFNVKRTPLLNEGNIAFRSHWH